MDTEEKLEYAELALRHIALTSPLGKEPDGFVMFLQNTAKAALEKIDDAQT